MTFPITTVSTVPFCGACGWDTTKADLGSDMVCDACGADLKAFGFAEEEPEVLAPAEGARKAVLLAWLEGRGVTGVDSLTKAELWDCIDGIVG